MLGMSTTTTAAEILCQVVETTWLQVMPEQPRVYHPSAPGGFFVADEAALRAFVEAWAEFTRGGEYMLPVYVEHRGEAQYRGRIGHVARIEYREGSGLWGEVAWTTAGAQIRASGEFPYVSPGLYFGVVDDQGVEYAAVIGEISLVAAPHLRQNERICGAAAYQEGGHMPDEAVVTEEATAPSYDALVEELAALKAIVEELKDRLDELKDAAEDEAEVENAEEVVAEDVEKAEMRAQLDEYRAREASADVSRLIEAERILPSAQEAYLALRLRDPELFAQCASGLAPRKMTGAVGVSGDHVRAEMTGEDRYQAIFKRARALMSEGRSYHDAHAAACAEITEVGR